MAGDLAIVVVVLVSAVAMLAVALASNARSRGEAEARRERLVGVLRRVDRLSGEVEGLRSAAAEGVGEVVQEARRSRRALCAAIDARAAEVQASAGANLAAVAALSLLLHEASAGTSELMRDLAADGRRERGRLAGVMAARHAEVASHLSGGGLDHVVEAIVGVDRTAERFAQEDCRRSAAGRARIRREMEGDRSAALQLGRASLARIGGMRAALQEVRRASAPADLRGEAAALGRTDAALSSRVAALARRRSLLLSPSRAAACRS